MNHLDELIHIQQEYEYFTKHCKDITTKEEYHLLKKKPVFQSSYHKNIFTICDKRLANRQITEIKIGISQKIFWGIILFCIVALLCMVLVYAGVIAS